MEVKINEIRVEKKDDITKRARTDFGNIMELAESIKARGLMHPPVVNIDETGEKKYILIAGERRIRACIFNGMSTIPVTLFSDLDELDRKICELEENTIRQDLTWQEKIEVVRQLDELKRKRYGSANRSKNSEGWAIKDTAEALGISKGTASQDIKLANDLLNRPDLQKKVSKLPKHAARKIVNQTLEEEMMERSIKNNSRKLSIDLKLGNCVDLIDELEDESIDLWLTDPPFGSPNIVGVSSINAKSGKMPLYNTTKSNVSDDKTMSKVYKSLIPKVYKKLKPGAHIYVFFGHSWYCRLIGMLREVGFEVDDQPLIWSKGRPSVMAKDMHYMSSYEAILFGHKPPVKRILTKPINNVLDIPAIAPQKKKHPLQRPEALLKILIGNSSGVGNTVLDTFAGSASTIITAKKMKRNAIGFELDKGNFLRAQEIIKEELGE